MLLIVSLAGLIWFIDFSEVAYFFGHHTETNNDLALYMMRQHGTSVDEMIVSTFLYVGM